MTYRFAMLIAALIAAPAAAQSSNAVSLVSDVLVEQGQSLVVDQPIVEFG